MIGIYNSLIVSFLCIVLNAYAANDTSGLIPLISGTSQQIKDIIDNDLDSISSQEDKEDENVNIRLYYGCHCLYCMRLAQYGLKDVINTLGSHLDMKFYPYGNAQTIEEKGKLEFYCRHGPEECYGHKLHACALKHISNYTEAMLFNICMMQEDELYSNGSDNSAVYRCAKEMDLNSSKDAIITCANSDEGDQLLKYYGKESRKVFTRGVPRLLINGVRAKYFPEDLIHDICAIFKNPPDACQLRNGTISTITSTSSPTTIPTPTSTSS